MQYNKGKGFVGNHQNNQQYSSPPEVDYRKMGKGNVQTEAPAPPPEVDYRKKGKGFVNRRSKAPPETEARVKEALAMFGEMKGMDEEIRALFSIFDRDHNGWMSKEEFAHFHAEMDKMGMEETEGQMEAILNQYNMLGDDKLSYDEFALLVLKMLNW
eukprot:TRINITY_DN3467_c0_g1_i1.p1 TRINITY_DN3467_c0_g1~~TRINITY_DN3467_c0_g1_i1.p1  ORF type:complete len:157 (-),score=38.80 TRINITY_DN3467_c0_g1_i1:163-633(-)